MARRRHFARRRAFATAPRARWRWLRGTVFVVLGAVGLSVFVTVGVLWSTVPTDNQTLRIPGLAAAVEVTLDGNGVPWIHAANEQDAATALGYVHARDRMFQMDLMRRAASGRLAELVGPAALPLDKQMRVLGLGRLAEGDLAAQSPETRALLEAYTAGVNAWIAQRGRFAALEFLYFGTPEPWRPSDSLLWGRTMSLWLSTNYRTELARQALRDKIPIRLLEQLWPPHAAPPPPQATVTDTNKRYAVQPDPLPGKALQTADPTGARLSADAAAGVLAALPAFPAPFTLPSSASDAWAVDGRHTETGAPMMAGDPHLSFEFPSLWYLVRIATPGQVLVGATAPGTPFLVLGHNGSIAWSFTTTGADTQDVYLEPQDVPIASHQERIKVRGQPDTILTVRDTRHGPVISDLMPGNRSIMAIAMENLMPHDTGATGLLALNHARTVEEAGKSAPLIISPVQNLMVADRTKIGLFVTGRVPIRRAGDGWASVPGTSAIAMAADEPTRAPSAQTATGQALPAAPAPAAIPSAQASSAPDAAAPDKSISGTSPPLSAAQYGKPAQTNDDPYGWIGFASGEALPHIVAPASGRLVNANEPVWPPNFPVLMARDTFSDWRARRIRTLLDITSKHSTSDFAAMQVDPVSTYAAALLPMLRVVPGAPQILHDWDGAMTENAPQPLIFAAWMQAFQNAVLAKAGVPLWAASPIFEFVPFVLSPEGRSWCGGDCAALLKSTLDSTMASLATRFGPDPAVWRWGTVHQAVFAHPVLRSVPVLGALTAARIAMPGDATTLDCGGTNAAFEAVHGASFRGVYDLADLDRSLFMMAPGQSGNLLSRHARDFLTRWRDGAMVMLPPRPVEISGTIRLEP